MSGDWENLAAVKLPAAFEILRNNQDLVRLADTKVSFLLIVHGMIVSSVVEALPRVKETIGVETWKGSATVLVLLLFTFVALSVISVFLVILSRSSDPRGVVRAKKGFVFFGHVCAETLSSYQKAFEAAGPRAILVDVLKNVHDVSAILQVKYAHLRRAFIFSFAAFAVWGLLTSLYILGL